MICPNCEEPMELAETGDQVDSQTYICECGYVDEVWL